MDFSLLDYNPEITMLNIPASMEGIISFELDAMVNLTDYNGIDFCEPLNIYRESPDADFYSIYARFKMDNPNSNPLECIVDCTDYQTAFDLCFQLEEMLKANNYQTGNH